ncbi:MAG: TPM domain-containing protein [bacterium]|nr:TPM domain-containing protein [bacterium]MBK8131181.1 TPM domain-containing protein [bacterium]
MKARNGILHRLVQIALSLLLAGSALADEANPAIPEPIGYITDYARAIAPADERKLAQVAGELERKTGVRIRVLTLPYLGGMEMNDIARTLLAKWSESPAVQARTILIVDALAEKKMRIEYGSEISAMLSEEASKRMQQQVMLPYLAQGDRGSAYFLAVTELSVAIGLEQRVALYTVPGYLKLQPALYDPRGAPPARTNELLLFVPLLIFMIGMARLETKMARATVVFGEVFQARWRGRWNRMQGRK